MKKYFLVGFILFPLCLLDAQQLKVWGNALYFLNNNSMLEVIRFHKSPDLYGYDVIDSNWIFVAYQPEGYAEASSIISLVEISSGKEIIITELGGAGESYFSYNSATGKLIFNWVDGLYTLNIFDKSKNVPLKRKPQRVLPMKGYGDFGKPFWVDKNKIGILRFDEKGKERRIDYYDLKN